MVAAPSAATRYRPGNAPRAGAADLVPGSVWEAKCSRLSVPRVDSVAYDGASVNEQYGTRAGMAILWKKKVDGTTYEVRSAGRSLRLYENGVLHSQYNSANPLTGSVWDLLWLPALFYPHGTVGRVLVLGVGGGAAIAQLRRYVGPELIIGVDLNRVHLRLARQFFALNKPGVKLCHEDAVRWLKQYAGPKFDLIIDDLFGEQDRQPQRAVTADSRWLGAQLKHLNPGGMLIANFESDKAFRQCGYFARASVARRFKAVYRLTSPRCENVVGVFSRDEVIGRDLYQRIDGWDELRRAMRSKKRRLRMRRVA
jgi:spermidine synthase